MKRAPLFRARLLRLGADDHVLLLILHHIIVDGWSIGVFMEEISELYAAFAHGRPSAVARAGASIFRLRALATSVVPPAMRQPGSSAIGRSDLREASPVFPATVILTAPCWARACARTSSFGE